MNILSGVLVFLFFSSVSYGQEPGLLEKYRWKNRLILLFSSDPASAHLVRQQEILKEDASGIRDRDLLIKVITQESPRDWQALREQFDIKQPFTLLLIGKDGGVKKRSDQVVSRESLYSLIDSMPMRRAEMRRDDQK